jgi:hypothetical protein
MVIACFSYFLRQAVTRSKPYVHLIVVVIYHKTNWARRLACTMKPTSLLHQSEKQNMYINAEEQFMSANDDRDNNDRVYVPS